jgi:fatty acid desaturase
MPDQVVPIPCAGKHDATSIGEFQTWILISAIYGGWFSVTWFFESLPWWVVLPAGTWFVAWHNSFQHEALHGHPSRQVWLNESLAWPPLCLWIPYPVYRDSHHAHHETAALTDPYDDPESFYLTRSQWARTGPVRRALLVFNNTLAGRVITSAPGPFISRCPASCLRGYGRFAGFRRWTMS